MKHTNANANANANPITVRPPYMYKAVLRAQDPHVQLTQLDWLGNLSSLLSAAEDCFVTKSAGAYSANMRAWNTSGGENELGYPERGPHKLPGVCSLTWRAGSWEMHLLIRDFLEVIDGLFKDGRLSTTRQLKPGPGSGITHGAEVYLAGDFTVQRRRYEPPLKCGRYYYELGYTPATMRSIRIFALVEQKDLGNICAVLARYGVQLPEGDAGK